MENCNMLKVLNVFPVNNMFSVTLEGACDKLCNGCKLTDSMGNSIIVASVAMVKNVNPSEIKNTATILTDCPNLKKGDVLFLHN